ncbi:MAG: ornithine cyclodeaminase family protein [Acidobacteriota bacterium]
MSCLVISHTQVRELLPMATCIDLMAEALVTLGRGEATNPLRWGMRLPAGQGILGMMPGQMGAPATLGLKVVAVFPGNHGTPYDSHQGVVLLFDPEHGFPTAIVDAAEITAIRTAAVSGLATRLLAREDATDLAILGSGVQARTHLEAMRTVREVARVRVYSRSRENRESFAATESKRHDLEVEAVGSAEAAVRGADLICTTTSAREPILCGDWLAPGAHLNAVGSSVASARELDSQAVVRSRLSVDRRESTLNEGGDFLFPKQEGLIDNDHIQGEIGEILLGQMVGRRTPEEITLFKSLGLAVEDLAAAHYVYQQAREQGLGTPTEIGEIPS